MAHIVEHLSVEELEARYRAAQDATEARHFQAIWLLAQGRTFLEVAEVLALVPRWAERLAARYDASGPEALGDRRRRNGKGASPLTPGLAAALGRPRGGAARGAGRRRTGEAASLLTPELLAALAERLERPPEDGGVWSGPEVAAWMARRLGSQKVHPPGGWDAARAPARAADGVWRGAGVAAWMARRLGSQKVHPQRGWDALRRLGWSLQSPRPRHPRAATPAPKGAPRKSPPARRRGPRGRHPG